MQTKEVEEGRERLGLVPRQTMKVPTVLSPVRGSILMMLSVSHGLYRSRAVAFAPQADFWPTQLCRRVSVSRAEPRHAVCPRARHAQLTSIAARDRGVGGEEAVERRDIRVFVEHALSPTEGAHVAFSREQGHYLQKVMRVAEGAEVKVFDGVHGEWWCRLDMLGKKLTQGVLTEQRRSMAAEADVWICFAPVKGDGTEAIVQKSTELGACKLVPVLTQRTVVKALRLDRLKSISIEASEQSERLSVPEFEPPQPLMTLLRQWPSDRWLILCDETAPENAGSSCVEILQALPGDAKYAVAVGPEGGWTEEELEAFKRMEKVVSIGLGPRILRADTAAVAAMTLVQSFVGDWQRGERG